MGRLGDFALQMPAFLVDVGVSPAVIASVAPGESPASPPTEAAITRCRCVLDLAGDLPADLAASALEACTADPGNFIASLGARGLDTSSCSGGGATAPIWQNPWVVGGAALAVLGGLAYVALR